MQTFASARNWPTADLRGVGLTGRSRCAAVTLQLLGVFLSTRGHNETPQ